MNNTTFDPIPLRPLVNEFWVFTLYGVVVSAALWIAMSLGVETELIRKIMMEPMSFHVCGSLLAVGMVLLLSMYVALRGNASRMKSSRWVKHFFLPISNAGLSAGALIAGMAFGICVGTSIYALFEAQAGSAVRLLFLTDVVFLAMLYPLYWIQRSMFDETKEEKNRSAIVSGIYLTLVLVAFWFFSRQAFWFFWYTVGAIVVVLAAVGLYMQKKPKSS